MTLLSRTSPPRRRADARCTSFGRLAAGVLLVLTLAPQAGSAQQAAAEQPAPRADTVPTPDTAAATVAPAAAATAARAAEVPVGVGDRVRVKVWREPTFSDDNFVNDRGEIVLPQLGPVHVAGLRVGDVRDTLVARYSVYLRNPSIDVVVYRRVGVQGAVRLPNTYYVDATKSMREVITEAGGPLETAKLSSIHLVRDGRTIAVTKLDNAGAVGLDLRSGDQIVVPRLSWWSLNALALVSTLGVVVPVGLSVVNYLRK